LGTAAYVTALERRSVGKFPIEDAISLDFLQEIGQGSPASDQILSIMTVLDDIPAVALTDTEATRLRFGQRLSLDPERQALLRQTFADLNDKEHPYRAIAVFDKRPVALVEIEDDVLSPLRVLNL
jgi:tRNA pseudouridine55 synthase